MQNCGEKIYVPLVAKHASLVPMPRGNEVIYTINVHADHLSMKVRNLLYFGTDILFWTSLSEPYNSQLKSLLPNMFRMYDTLIHVQEVWHPHTCSGCMAPSYMFRMYGTLIHQHSSCYKTSKKCSSNGTS